MCLFHAGTAIALLQQAKTAEVMAAHAKAQQERSERVPAEVAH